MQSDMLSTKSHLREIFLPQPNEEQFLEDCVEQPISSSNKRPEQTQGLVKHVITHYVKADPMYPHMYNKIVPMPQPPVMAEPGQFEDAPEIAFEKSVTSQFVPKQNGGNKFSCVIPHNSLSTRTRDESAQLSFSTPKRDHYFAGSQQATRNKTDTAQLMVDKVHQVGGSVLENSDCNAKKFSNQSSLVPKLKSSPSSNPVTYGQSTTAENVFDKMLENQLKINNLGAKNFQSRAKNASTQVSSGSSHTRSPSTRMRSHSVPTIQTHMISNASAAASDNSSNPPSGYNESSHFAKRKPLECKTVSSSTQIPTRGRKSRRCECEKSSLAKPNYPKSQPAKLKEPLVGLPFSNSSNLKAFKNRRPAEEYANPLQISPNWRQPFGTASPSSFEQGNTTKRTEKAFKCDAEQDLSVLAQPGSKSIFNTFPPSFGVSNTTKKNKSSACQTNFQEEIKISFPSQSVAKPSHPFDSSSLKNKQLFGETPSQYVQHPQVSQQVQTPNKNSPKLRKPATKTHCICECNSERPKRFYDLYS